MGREEIASVAADIASQAFPASRDAQGRLITAAEKREASVYLRGRMDGLAEFVNGIFGGDA